MNEKLNQKGYEKKDTTFGPIMIFITSLFFILLIVIASTKGFYQFLDVLQNKKSMTTPTQTQPIKNTEPQLQVVAKLDIDQLKVKENDHLNHYRWIDQEKQIAQVPIDHAIEILIPKINS